MSEAQKQKLKEDEIKRDMLKNQVDLSTKQAQLESEDAYRRGMVGTRQEEIGLLRERNVLDKTRADQTRQMAEISDYISNFRSKNVNNPKYINKPDLLEQDAIGAAMRFFGPDRFKNLGLAPGIGATAPAPSGPRPPLSSFQR